MKTSIKRWIIAIILVVVVALVGSAAFAGLWRECIVCGKHGFLYNGVEIDGEYYYACPDHEQALARVAYAYKSGQMWAESFYGALSDEAEFMYGSFMDTFDRMMQYGGAQP